MARCLDCQHVKVECKHVGGFIQLIAIPERKWEVIYMDFITGFPRTWTHHNSIMVFADRLTKVAHFSPMKSTFSVSDVAHVFIRDVVNIRTYSMLSPSFDILGDLNMA